MRVSIVLVSALLASTASAQCYVDNFTGDSIDTSFWQSVWEQDGLAIWQSGDALRIYGNSQTYNWGASAGVGTGYSYPAAGLTTSVDMLANGAEGGGWWAGMTIGNGSNSITYFESDSPLPRVGYTYYSNGVGYYNISLASQVGTRLTVECSPGTVSMFMDGKLLGTQALSLPGNVSVQLSSAAAAPWDAVDVVFTHFSLLERLSGGPGKPPSTPIDRSGSGHIVSGGN